jgi:hypothetical protein
MKKKKTQKWKIWMSPACGCKIYVKSDKVIDPQNSDNYKIVKDKKCNEHKNIKQCRINKVKRK